MFKVGVRSANESSEVIELNFNNWISHTYGAGKCVSLKIALAFAI